MTDEPQPTSELYLSPNDAYTYLKARLGLEFSRDTLYFWIRQDAFPNKQYSGQGTGKRYTIPVSDLDAFDPATIKAKPGRRADPNSPWHGYRDMNGNEQWNTQRRQRIQRKKEPKETKESET
jgi:hypothetical protein